MGGVVSAGPKIRKNHSNFQLVSRQLVFCFKARRIVNSTNFPLTNFWALILRVKQMNNHSEPKRFIVDSNKLPALYPTHLHDAKFWEALGRTVGTFGFLEEVLGKAIFAFTGTKEFKESEVDAAYELWVLTLTKALSDPLGGLIDTYGKAVREHPNMTISNLNELVGELRDASVIRNALCHGSWRLHDNKGKSVPFFVNRQGDVFSTAFDVSSLLLLQKSVTELSVAVVNTVTHMGWQFPGSTGPGNVIWSKTK